MAIGTLHALGAVVVGGSGGFNLGGITNVQVNPNLAMNMQTAGGQVDQSHISVLTAAPTLSVTFTDIKTGLDNIALNGMCFPQTTVITTVDFYFTKITKCAPRASGSNHFRVRMSEGLAIPTSISQSHGRITEMTVDFHAIYDGTNAPFIFATGQALPHTPVIDELFTLGPMSVNGSALSGVQTQTINFGINAESLGSDGQVYPTFVGIATKSPSVEVTTKEVLALNTYGLLGTAQTSTDSVVFIQKMDRNAHRVAAGTSEHIQLTLDDGMIIPGSAGGSNESSSDASFVYHPAYDGSNDIFVFDTTAAIS